MKLFPGECEAHIAVKCLVLPNGYVFPSNFYGREVLHGLSHIPRVNDSANVAAVEAIKCLLLP